jgi:hypothetical protein
MPYAEFSPQGRPGEDTDSLLSGLSAGQSWMERNQAMQLRDQQSKLTEEQAQRARADYALMQPVMQAKRKAEIAEATNQLAGSVTMNDLMAQAQSEMPILRQDWAKTYSITDPKQRLEIQEQLLGNADRFASLKGSADEIKQWHEVWAQGQVSQRGKDLITGRNEVANARIDGLTQQLTMKQQHDLELQKVKQDAAEQLATLKAEQATALAGTRGEEARKTSATKAVSAGSYKANQALVDAGIAALPLVSQLDEAIALLDDPDVRTGTGAEFQLKAERLGQFFGADTKNVHKTEELQSILGSVILAKARDLKGSISDKDIAFLDRQSASLGKTAEGNKEILRNLQKALANGVAKAKLINDLRGEGESEPVINQAVNEYDLTNAIWNKPTTSVGIRSIKRIE